MRIANETVSLSLNEARDDAKINASKALIVSGCRAEGVLGIHTPALLAGNVVTLPQILLRAIITARALQSPTLLVQGQGNAYRLMRSNSTKFRPPQGAIREATKFSTVAFSLAFLS